MNDDEQPTGPLEFARRRWERLVEMHGFPTCVMCDGKQWDLYGANLLTVGSMVSGPTETWTPVYTVRCAGCGQLLVFEAVSLGSVRG